MTKKQAEYSFYIEEDPTGDYQVFRGRGVQMKISIEKVVNGYILEYDHEHYTGDVVRKKLLVEEKPSEARTFRELVYLVMDQFDVNINLHGQEQFYPAVGPDINSEEFTEEHERILLLREDD